MEQPINPCKECLVRACCSETCLKFSTYIIDVVSVIAHNPNNKVVENFSEEQVKLILSTAKLIKRKRDVIKKE